jgi:hypothetical protein
MCPLSSDFQVQLMDGEAVHDFSKSLGSGLQPCSEFLPQREIGWISGLSGYGVF